MNDQNEEENNKIVINEIKRESNGRFLKGFSGNPNGRPLGSALSQELRELVLLNTPQMIESLYNIVMCEEDVPAIVKVAAIKEWFSIAFPNKGITTITSDDSKIGVIVMPKRVPLPGDEDEND